MKHLFLSVLLMAATMAGTYAQSPLKLPPLSANTKITQDFSVSSIELSYGRPSMRGRKIFGDVVPYGKAWRTGANAPTKIKIGEELEIGGVKVRAGQYNVYTIPDRDKWEIVLSNDTANMGPDGFSRDFDVARFTIKPSKIDGECQTFTILISDITFTTCNIEIVWERTKVVIPVVAHNSERIEDNIDQAINHPAPLPYFQAASYYFESNRHLDFALDYVNKATEQQPKAFYVWYLKARIEKKLGHEEEAITAAKKSMELAKGAALEREYMTNNQKIIDEIKRKHHRQTVD